MPTETQLAFFVTGATGGQGGEVARQLLALGHRVNALVRDPSKPQAINLQSQGARLIEGDYDDLEALLQASAGCSGVFLNTMPGPDEAKHADNVIAAAREAKVSNLVCSTVTRAGEHETFPDWDPNGILAAYWRSKAAVQEKVKASGLEHWTVLQPAWLMTNFVAPTSRWYWPELVTDGVLLSAFGRDTKIELTDPADVGSFAVKALTNPGSQDFDKKIIKVASEALTLDEIAAVMSGVAGRPVSAGFRSEDEIAGLLKKNPIVFSHNWQRLSGSQVDIGKVQAYDIPLNSFSMFLHKEKDALEQAVTLTQ